jgi:hypothetical protein
MINFFKRDPSLRKDRLTREYVYIFIFLALIFAIIIPFSRSCSIKEKQADTAVWKPWLALKSNQIHVIKLQPYHCVECETISHAFEIRKQELFNDIKENMDRKFMEEEDRPGYHWFSTKRVLLTASTISGDYSFKLNFNDSYPSVQYQMLRNGNDGAHAVGQAWRSAQLYRIIMDVIEKTRSVRWVKSEG